MKRLVIFTDLEWSLGALHRELAEALNHHDWNVELVSWARKHTQMPQADLYMTLPSCVGPLHSTYGIPKGKIAIVAHAESDIHDLVKKEGVDGFAQYAEYAVTSDTLACSSLSIGVKRIPFVVRCGIDSLRFFAQPAQKLTHVGYATVMRRANAFGVEQKRGQLAKEIVEACGMTFVLAEHETVETMPKFYQGVDAVIIPALQDGSPRPPLEGAAAGRLVISTPVGHMPRLVLEGLGVMGPLDAEMFRTFATEQLIFYRGNLGALTEICRRGQEAAQRRSWGCIVNDWLELFKRAELGAPPAEPMPGARKSRIVLGG